LALGRGGREAKESGGAPQNIASKRCRKNRVMKEQGGGKSGFG